MTQPAINAAPDTIARTRAGRPRSVPSWARMFVSGLVLWSAAVLVTMATGNANLIPTIILLGSFLVPVTFVTYAFGHADQVVTAQRISPPSSPAGARRAGRLHPGGRVAAAAVRAGLPGRWAGRGGGQAGHAVALARRLPRYTMRDGIVLGAAVGFGFARGVPEVGRGGAQRV
jgi:protease PrsW